MKIGNKSVMRHVTLPENNAVIRYSGLMLFKIMD